MIKHTSFNLNIAPVAIIKDSADMAWLYCACLYYCGYSDWRLPTFVEWGQSTPDELSQLAYFQFYNGAIRDNFNHVVPVRDI